MPKEQILIKEATINEAVKVNATITEFDAPNSKDYFQERYKGKEYLIIVAYINNRPVGYIVSYDKFNDGSLYCWMAGVDPQFRRRGVLKTLMQYQDKWAKQKGYKKIKIKTRNNHRAMLAYLVKYGFYFTTVEPYSDIQDNRVLLEKNI